MTITVRPAERRDAARIVEMAKALTDFENELRDPGSRNVCRLTEAELDKHCFGERPLIFALVAEADGAIVGHAIYDLSFNVETASVGLWISDLFVEERARRSGVGRALMAGLAEACRRHDADWLGWQVVARNAAAQAFYDRFGLRDHDLAYWTPVETLRERLR